MSNTITLTVELGPESQAKLDKILQALEGLRPNCASNTENAQMTVNEYMESIQNAAPTEESTAPQDAPKSEPVKEDTPEVVVTAEPEPEVVAPVEEVKPTITLDQIRQKITVLMAAGGAKKTGARDIVKSYAPNVTGLKEHEDKWPEIWDKLTALEG